MAWLDDFKSARREFPDPLNDGIGLGGFHIPSPQQVRDMEWRERVAAEREQIRNQHGTELLAARDDRVRTRKANSENARMARAAWEHRRHFSPAGSPKIIIGLILVLLITLLIAAIPAIAVAL